MDYDVSHVTGIRGLWENVEVKKLQDRILYAIFMVQMVSKRTFFSGMEVREDHNVDTIEVQCPENSIRQEEELIDLEFVINEIQNKFYF